MNKFQQVAFFLFLFNIQYVLTQDVMPRVGIKFQIGTHIKRVGAMYHLVYKQRSSYLIHSGGLYYNIKNLGPPIKGLELKMNLGYIYNWGSYFSQSEYLFSDESSFFRKENSIGFVSSYYFNKTGTNQWLGKFLIKSKNTGFVFENDLFGPKGYQDKYRTAAVAFIYTHGRYEYKLKTMLWTGKSIEGEWIKDSEYPAVHGYKNLKKAKYGKYSHGILSLGMDYSFDYYQVVGLDIGIDAEQVRHALQNRFMHDIILQEKIIRYKNPHYPMLQNDGNPYLFQEDTKVKRASFYFQSGLNRSLFY